jgi:hypothetical protein
MSHFLVEVEGDVMQPVRITYCFNNGLRDVPQTKCLLRREKWDLIAPALQDNFRRRLHELKLPISSFKRGVNYLDRLLGKELLLLAYAVEDSEISLVSKAIQNWQGLAPEERWWLTMMCDARGGDTTKCRNIGWRAAVRVALTENPTS